MNNDRVEYMVNNLKQLEQRRFQFSKEYGFAYKRPQNYKDCIVVRWKPRKRKDKNFIDYDRIEEYVAICHEISQKYNLYDEKDLLLESSLRLIKIGIYVSPSYHLNTWAIPNEFKEIQEYVLSKLPSWATVSFK
jgi:hypothetical protein